MSRQQQFIDEMLALLRKYDVAISIEEDVRNYSYSAQINVYGHQPGHEDEAGNWVAGETIDLYFTYEDGKG